MKPNPLNFAVPERIRAVIVCYSKNVRRLPITPGWSHRIIISAIKISMKVCIVPQQGEKMPIANGECAALAGCLAEGDDFYVIPPLGDSACAYFGTLVIARTAMKSTGGRDIKTCHIQQYPTVQRPRFGKNQLIKYARNVYIVVRSIKIQSATM